MVYTAPSTKQITLAIPGSGLSNLVLRQGQDEGWYNRAIAGGYRSEGKTRLGSTRLNRDGFKPYFVWSIATMIRETDLALAERIYSTIQNAPTTQVVLTDEFSYVDQLQASWHNRTVVSGSTKTLGGIQRSLCSFNVLLQFDESQAIKVLGGGFHLLSFTAEEILS